MDFAVEIERLDDCVVVRVEGELDLASAAAFEDALVSRHGSPEVIVDLSSCTFLDSSGMRAIAGAAREASRVSIVATDPSILRVLEITALDTTSPFTPRSKTRDSSRLSTAASASARVSWSAKTGREA